MFLSVGPTATLKLKVTNRAFTAVAAVRLETLIRHSKPQPPEASFSRSHLKKHFLGCCKCCKQQKQHQPSNLNSAAATLSHYQQQAYRHFYGDKISLKFLY